MAENTREGGESRVPQKRSGGDPASEPAPGTTPSTSCLLACWSWRPQPSSCSHMSPSSPFFSCLRASW